MGWFKKGLITAFSLLLLSACASPREDPLPRTWVEDGLVYEEEFAPAVSEGKNINLHVLSARKEGPEPKPVVLLTHGSSTKSRTDLVYRYTVYDVIKYKWLLKHFAEKGYAAFFFGHKGHSRSGGQIADFSCGRTNYEDIANSVGQDFADVHKYAATKPWADATETVIGGQSTGGVGALAYASRQPAGVVGVLNFAGTYTCFTGGGTIASNIWNNTTTWRPQILQGSSINQLWVYGSRDNYTRVSDVDFVKQHPTIELQIMDKFHHGVMRKWTWEKKPEIAEGVDRFLAKLKQQRLLSETTER